MEIIYLVVLGVIGVILVSYFLKRKVSRVPEVVLYGLPNSGKTKLFYMVNEI